MKKLKIKINGKNIDVLFAKTSKEKLTGIRTEEDLNGSDGMLFLTPEGTGEQKPYFTMENTKIDLDIIFINEGKVVHFVEAKSGDSIIRCSKDFKYVLEVKPETFLRKYLLNSEVTFKSYESDEIPLLRKGGSLVYRPKVDDIPIEEGKYQLLDENGFVAANLGSSTRVFSRRHTLEFFELLRDGKEEELADAMLKALDQQDTQEQAYV